MDNCLACNKYPAPFGYVYPAVSSGREIHLCGECRQRLKAKACGHDGLEYELLNKLWECKNGKETNKSRT